MTYLYLGSFPDTPAPVLCSLEFVCLRGAVQVEMQAFVLRLCCNVGYLCEMRACVGTGYEI